MTPAPHTPITIIKAGGAAFFSTRCIALLAEYGYAPEDFGTYDSVLERLRAARKAVEDHKNGTGPTPDPRSAELGKPLSDPDHYQSGHLGMNTCMQRKRDQACTNYVTGHDMGDYPCMPHQGNATDAGSEHNRWTVQEVDDPLSKGSPRGTYPASEMEKDADKRIDTLLNNRAEEIQEEGQGATLGRLARGTEAEKQQALAEAEEMRRKSLEKTGAEALKESDRIDGKSAAECLSNFRKAGVEAMRKKCADDVEKNEALARGENPSGTPRADMPKRRDDESPEKYRQRLKDEAAAAEKKAETTRAGLADQQKKVDTAKRSWSSYKGKLTTANSNLAKAEAAASTPPTKAQKKEIRAAKAEVKRYEKECRKAERKHAKEEGKMKPALDAEAQASSARSASDRAEAANCKAEQGDKLRRDPDHGRDGKRPAPWDDLPRDDGTNTHTDGDV